MGTLEDAFNDLKAGKDVGGLEIEDPIYESEDDGFIHPDIAGNADSEPDTSTPDMELSEDEEETGDPANTASEADPLDTAPAEAGKLEDSEYIFVSDDTGRKKLKVDYSDREGIKTAYKLAAGFQKMKVERDRFLTQNREVGKELESLKEFQGKLNKVYSDSGIEGIYNAIRAEGMPEWNTLVVQEALKAQRYQQATPEERRAMDEGKELQKLKAAQAEWLQQQEVAKTQAEQAREEAELEKFTAMVTPSFEKYRFAEIADQAKAERMDARLWREAKERFKELESEGKDVTAAVAAKVFKDIADDIRSLISTQATQQATDVVEKKKKVAQTKVAGATDRGRGKAAAADTFAEDALKVGGLQAFYNLIGRK